MSAVLAPAAPQSPQSPQPAVPITPPETGVRPRRWTREEYYRAAEIGLFRPDERLELLGGEILEKVTENAPHVTGLDLTLAQLVAAFAGQSCYARVQHPISLLGAESDPEPDIAFVTGTPRDYQVRHPQPPEIVLLAEVSSTTLAFDLGRKAAAYASAAITEYWVLDLGGRRLHVHREPHNGAYQSITPLNENEVVSPLNAPQASIRVADLLPSPTV
jgi:Uma2 family endonuclease